MADTGYIDKSTVAVVTGSPEGEVSIEKMSIVVIMQDVIPGGEEETDQPVLLPIINT